MPSSKGSKKHPRSGKFQTFDAEDFDTHALDHSIRSKIFPFSKNEPTGKVLQDIRRMRTSPSESQAPKKSFLVAFAGNILLPGLGNVYAYSSPFSISILALSLLTLLVTFSPVFPLVSILHAAGVAQPTLADSTIPVLVVPQSVVVQGQLTLVGPTFSILAVPLLLAWIHLLYLVVGHAKSSRMKWTI